MVTNPNHLSDMTISPAVIENYDRQTALTGALFASVPQYVAAIPLRPRTMLANAWTGCQKIQSANRLRGSRAKLLHLWRCQTGNGDPLVP